MLNSVCCLLTVSHKKFSNEKLCNVQRSVVHVAQWLAHWPLVLEVPGSIPAAGEENLVSQHTSLHVICRDDMNTVLHVSPSDRDVNWRLPVQGVIPVQNPTSVINCHFGVSSVNYSDL